MDFWESSNGKGGHIGNLENLCPLFMHKQHLRNLLRHCLGQSFFMGHYFVGHFLWTLEIVNLWGFLWISSIIRRPHCPKLRPINHFLCYQIKAIFQDWHLYRYPASYGDNWTAGNIWVNIRKSELQFNKYAFEGDHVCGMLWLKCVLRGQRWSRKKSSKYLGRVSWQWKSLTTICGYGISKLGTKSAPR